jgi:TniQ
MAKPNTTFILPPRAQFMTEPRGLGTWQRQRLSNYLVSVAADARVTPQAILNNYVAWPTCVPDRAFGACMRLDLVNGTGLLARRWVSAVSPLVGRSDLDDLTLLPFAHVLGTGGGLVSPWRRWCAHCLYDDVAAGGLPYERLIWSVAHLNICPLHLTPLISSCPSCGSSQRSELSRRCLSGFCGVCEHWLGREWSRADVVDRRTSLNEYEIWVARDFANLLQLNAEAAKTLSRPKAVDLMRAGLDSIFGGKTVVFAEHASVRWSTLQNWFSRGSLPSARSLIRLSWSLGIPLRSWLQGDTNAWATFERRGVPSEVDWSKPRDKPKHADWPTIERELRASIDSNTPYPSWAAAARAQHIDPSYLQTRFPELTARIRDAGRKRRHEASVFRAGERARVLETATVLCVKDLISRKIYPAKKKVEDALRVQGIHVDFATYQVIRSVRGRFASELSTLGLRRHGPPKP